MAGPRHIDVGEASRPVLPRHTRLKFDATRQVWVILAPERVLAPDEIAVEVLQLCDGVRSVGQIVDQLAAWKSGVRPPGPLGLMPAVAAQLSDADAMAVARYYAGLAAQPPGAGQNKGAAR